MIGDNPASLLKKMERVLDSDEQPLAVNQVAEYGTHRRGEAQFLILGLPEVLGVIGSAIKRYLLRQPKPVVEFKLAHSGFLTSHAYIVLTDRRIVLFAKRRTDVGDEIVSWPVGTVEIQVDGSQSGTIYSFELVFTDGSSIAYERLGPDASRLDDWVANGAVPK